MAIDSIIKITGAITAATTSNDVSSVDMQEDGHIMSIIGMLYAAYTPAAAAGANTTLLTRSELSFGSTNQFEANDSRLAIMNMSVATVLFAFEATETGGAGGKISETQVFNPPEGIPVAAGERIHLHVASNVADLSGTAIYLIYLKTAGGARRARKRR